MSHVSHLRSLLLCCAVTLLAAEVVSQPASVDLQAEWRLQLDDLATHIEVRRALVNASKAHHPAAAIHDDDRTPVDIVLRRSRALLEHYANSRILDAATIADYRQRLDALTAKAQGLPVAQVELTKVDEGHQGHFHVGRVTNAEALMLVFAEASALRRELALREPDIATMDRILFAKRFPPSQQPHMCDEWYGRNSEPGGGMFVLENPFSEQPILHDYTAQNPVNNGQYAGSVLDPGCFVTPEVSYDGDTIYFAYSGNQLAEPHTNVPERYLGDSRARMIELALADGKRARDGKDYYYHSPETAYHIFAMDADGGNLRQLTEGTWNDFDPAELPDGRIVFLSERRGGEGRCHPRPCPAYVMYSMLPDGSDITPFSHHEINEWSPTVTNDGQVIYARWDYVDRPAAAGQHPWICKQDGRDPRALYGNYEGGGGMVHADLRPVPDSPLFFGTMYGHHAASYGTLIVYDSRIVDDGTRNAWTFLTPDVPGYKGREWHGAYTTPFPVNETSFLACYSPDAKAVSLIGGPYQKPPTPHGLYLMDVFGNKTLLYRDAEIPVNGPFPLQPRQRPLVQPHVLANALPPGMDKPATSMPADEATVAVMNVYESKLPWPEDQDRTISALRIIQILPKSTPNNASPPIGYDGEFVARQILGTVPVEKDGSTYFRMPAGKSVYFQALDQNGLAIQSMRSSTYAMPGEAMTCQGCHEPQGKTFQRNAQVMAMQREPSEIRPAPKGSKPFSFVRLIQQPILDKKCVDCHEKNLDKTFSLRLDAKPSDKMKKRFKELKWNYARSFPASYSNLLEYAWCYNMRGGHRDDRWGVVDNNPDRSVPGTVGAYVAPLYQLLTEGSHKDRVELSDEDMERLVTWLDAMSLFYGAYEDTKAQKAGEIVYPSVE